ncbi:MAG: hypothetical protein PVS3B2_04460 [Candidatus Dormibacteraceae bacterium]
MDAHLPGFLDYIGYCRVRVDEEVVDRFLDSRRRLHVQREVALGVEIDEEHPLTQLREGGAKVDGGGGFTNTPLLHGDGYRSGQDWPESSGRRGFWPNAPGRNPLSL